MVLSLSAKEPMSPKAVPFPVGPKGEYGGGLAVDIIGC
jgi:hypothetical protein